jgi:hypothetical protein
MALAPLKKEMGVNTTDEVKNAMEFLVNSSLADQVWAAYMLLRVLSTNDDIGVVGRGFIRESFAGVAAVMDWMAMGSHEALKAAVPIEDMVPGEMT